MTAGPPVKRYRAFLFRTFAETPLSSRTHAFSILTAGHTGQLEEVMNANTAAATETAARQGTGPRTRGFTLVELVVTVAIVGILASASYGSYQNYVRRANRSAAQQFMLEVMNRQEMYLLDARAFATDVGATGLGLTMPDRVAQHYAITITLDAGPPPGYVITATPGGNQAVDGVLTLSSDGEKLPLDKWER